jgi:hypothetical protein
VSESCWLGFIRLPVTGCWYIARRLAHWFPASFRKRLQGSPDHPVSVGGKRLVEHHRQPHAGLVVRLADGGWIGLKICVAELLAGL